MGPNELEIHERDDGERLLLRVVGERDIASAPRLQKRLDRARAERRTVRLDVSALEFMDSTGIVLLVVGTRDAGLDGWHLELDPQGGLDTHLM